MSLRLEVVSRNRQELGSIGLKEFGHNGGTIGRSLSNDWALPDRERYLSAKHAAIDFRSGSYYIVDTSTNGVYVNESDTPVGRGNPQRLFTGDRVRIGDYVMVVKIEAEDESLDSLASDDHVDPVARAQRVENPEPATHDLLSEHELTGVGIEMILEGAEDYQISDTAKASVKDSFAGLSIEAADEPSPSLVRAAPLAGLNIKAAAPVKPKTRPQPPAKPARQQPRPAAAASTVTKPAQSAGSNDQTGDDTAIGQAVTAFFRGAGLDHRRLNHQQVLATFFLVGQLLREMLTGLSQNLHTRAEQKTHLRLGNTTIQKRDNNPLKFSAGTEEALANLLFRRSKEYLGPVESVRDAFTDITAHQRALLAALRATLPDYLSRLDPDIIEQKYARAAASNKLHTTNKAKYWELYTDLYHAVSQGKTGQLPTQFVEMLANAYLLELQKYKEATAHDSADKTGSVKLV